MNKKVSIPTTEEIFRLRNYLQQISHISFTFANINKRFPFEDINEEQGKEIITAYNNLMKDAKSVIEVFNNNLNPNEHTTA